MKTLIPRFNAERMVMDYVRKFYGPAARQGARFCADDYALAHDYASWKARLWQCWGGVALEPPQAPEILQQDESFELAVTAQLNGLAPGDVVVECLIGQLKQGFIVEKTVVLAPAGDGDNACFSATIEPLAGLQQLRVRKIGRARLNSSH